MQIILFIFIFIVAATHNASATPWNQHGIHIGPELTDAQLYDVLIRESLLIPTALRSKEPALLIHVPQLLRRALMDGNNGLIVSLLESPHLFISPEPSTLHQSASELIDNLGLQQHSLLCIQKESSVYWDLR